MNQDACGYSSELAGTEHLGMRQVCCVDCDHEWKRLKVTWLTVRDQLALLTGVERLMKLLRLLESAEPRR